MPDVPDAAAVRDELRAELDARERRDREGAERERRGRSEARATVFCACLGHLVAIAADRAIWGASFLSAPSFPWGRLLVIAAMALPAALLCGRLCGLIGPGAGPDPGPREGGEGRDG